MDELVCLEVLSRSATAPCVAMWHDYLEIALRNASVLNTDTMHNGVTRRPWSVRTVIESLSWTRNEVVFLLTNEELQTVLEQSEWIYANTMPHNPHEYTLREEWSDNALFDTAVTHIREHGYRAVFRGKAYVQLNLGEYVYWTMGAALHETILINRKRIGGYSQQQIRDMAQKGR